MTVPSDTVPGPAAGAPEFDRYDPAAVEQKWQQRWAERGTNTPDLERAERPYYQLMMFPYPSAEGLHVAMIPFGQGLGIGLGQLDSEQAHRVLHDAGLLKLV